MGRTAFESAAVGAGRALVRENPVSSNVKWALGTVVALGVLGTIVYLATKPAAAATGGGSGGTPPPPPPPPVSTLTWKQVTSIPPGAQARISLPVSLLAAMLPPNTVNSFGTWTQFATSMLGSLSTGLTLYPPSSTSLHPPSGYVARPADWPSDDTDTGNEYSAAFTYTAPIALPMPAGKFTAWVLS